MEIKLSGDEVDFAIHMYLAIKGYHSDARIYSTNRMTGLESVTCTNVKPQSFHIDRVIKEIQKR